MVTITTLGGGEGSHRLEGLQGPLEGYLNLHDDHVRGELAGQLEGFPVVWDLGDDLHAPVGGEYAGQALAEHGVVVGKQHPDRPVRVRVRDLVLSQHPSAPFCWWVWKGIVASTPFGATVVSLYFDDVGDIPTVLPASSSAIHRSAWKGNSANFALTEFSEVRLSSTLAIW